MSATRLDRLVILLETGSSQLIRNTAAEQLADVQKQHPDELFNLLTKVIPFLRSKSWDTRAAAAKAIGGIVDHAEKYDPNEDEGDVKSETNGHATNGTTDVKVEDLSINDDQLQLETLDVESILKKGKPLLGSAGKEYDYQFVGMDPTQRLAYQKKTLTARLGLGISSDDVDAEMGDLITSKDVDTPMYPMPPPGGISKLDTNVSRHNSISSPGVSTPMEINGDENGGLSKRQLNMLKRKNKQRLKSEANKVRIVDFSERKSSMADPDTPAVPHAVKLEVKKEESENGVNDYFSLDRKGADDDSQLVKEFKGMPVPEKSAFATEAEEDGSEWPFERLMEFLTVDLFDHAWEIRHGAAQGIREVIRAHGAGAGRLRGKTRAQNNLLNKRWLEDLAARLCCVFMLDRFGDYISDNVTVPVRENAGQALGAVLQHLPASSVKAIFGVLRRLLPLDKTASMWQPCHGGILGMRYLVAVRNDLLIDEPDLLDGVLEAVMRCLSDEDDDVRAVSAATLIPIAKEIVTTRPQILNQLIIEVWNCLSNLSDDLSASTGFVMDLLATLCSYQEVLEAMKANAAQDPELSFANLVPRLFPFLRHTISTVRSAVLRALLTFLNIKGAGTEGWINGKALRLVFQNLLVERELNVVRLSLQVWDGLVESLVSQNPDTFAAEFGPHIVPLLTLVMHPIGVPRHSLPMDATLFMRPSGQTYSLPTNGAARKASPQAGMEPPKKRRRSDKKEKDAIPSSNITHNIDAPMIQGEVELVGTETLIRSKLFAAQALGKAMASWPVASRLDAFGPHVIPYFASTFSTTQMTVGIVVEEYAKATTEKDELCLRFAAGLKPIAEGDRPVAYGDLTSYLHIVRAQCQSLINTFRDQGHVAQGKLPTMPVLVQGDPSASQFAFSITDAEKIVDADFERLKKGLSPAQRVTSTQQLLATQSDVKKAINEANTAKEQRDIRIKAAAAAAIVALDEVDYKRPSLTIKGMMDSVKNEENIELQRRSAFAVADLIKRMSLVGKQAVINKVAGNLCKFYCKETAETPEFWPNTGLVDGILSLNKDEDIKEVQDQVKYDREAKEARIMRRGAKEALERLVMDFGAKLFDKVPVLKSMIEKPVHAGFDADELPGDITEPDQSSLGQEIIDALSILRALVPKLHSGLHAFVIELMPLICKALRTRLGVLRYVAAKCFATICSVMNVSGFTMLVEKVLPSINNAIDVRCRQGAIECIYHLIHVMQEGILPYVVFLVVPTLGRMSDSNDDVRRIATTTFAHLVKLMPLEAGIEDPPGLSQDLLKGRERERKFITQMLDPKKVEDFPIPVSINAELRPYQQDGVNWLAFLNRYNLHGILCDDMGLGKTLQTLCMVASDHYNRAQEYRKTQAPEKRPLPSLIVCPPSLSGHWQQEIRTYAPFLKFVAFVGPSGERARKRSQLADTDIVITSYEVCRNEIDTLGTLDFNYCVLDEGHLIKNPKAKTTIAVKEVKAEHRLILSGTPIQNNVLELWSLFDFLMPGFLGSEKVFKDRFAKPIAASRGAKSSSKEQEAGALAIEALHKQVLPFLLRRLKEEVLNDLPPKILQNYYCDLSDLQRKLFQDFIKKEGDNVKSLAGSADTAGKQHIFQALQYMRKLCNSPAMVFKESHPQYEALKAQLAKEKTTLRDPIHAPKLGALRDLLVDCGIGAEDVDKTDKEKKENGPSQMPEPAVSQHRALIFCQMKEMLDMVQTEVLQKMLPSVQSLRLDGSVEAGKRQDIVNRFNSDPSYDVLLLTTSVGGLGLNLTGADTVIFVEHDWNPQKDMQAMDRAHRIGQKKVVNVYRIVTRGTLEEKILNLQRFKIDVASTVVNQQNAGLGTMETDQILDLFNVSSMASEDAAPLPPPDNGPISEEDAVDAEGNVREKGKKGFLDDIGELWDEKQYEEEYNLDSFLASMRA